MKSQVLKALDQLFFNLVFSISQIKILYDFGEVVQGKRTVHTIDFNVVLFEEFGVECVDFSVVFFDLLFVVGFWFGLFF